MTEQIDVKVLIVEDDFLVAEMVSGVLEETGYRVLGVADDGRQAVEMARNLQPDVIILDLHLPVMDGFETARAINTIQPTPIVVLTAYDRPEFVEEATRCGVGAFLVKPPSAKELDRAITVARARFADLMELRRLNERLAVEAEERRKKEAEYRSIIETTSDGFWMMDLEGRCLEVNQAFADMLGYEQEELVGKYIQDVEAQESAEETARHIEDAVQNGGARFETRHRHKDGRVIDVEISTNFLADQARFIVFARDITERKRSALALFENEQKYRLLHENAGVGIGYYTVDGTIISFNRLAAQHMGGEPADYAGKSLRDLFPADAAQEYMRRHQLAIHSGTAQQYDDYVDLPSGGKWFTSVYTRIVDVDDNVIGVQIISQDVTRSRMIEEERKKNLSELQRRTKELESLLEGSKAILKGGDFSDTARKIFDIAREMTGAQSGYVALLSSDGQENELLFLEAGGLPCSVDPNLPMPVRGLRAEAYKAGEVVVENDFMHSPWVDFMPAGHVDLDNVLFSPLTIDGKTHGIMGLANKPTAFTDDDRRMAEALGRQAAIALKNSRYLDAIRRSEEKFRGMAENLADVFFVTDEQGRIEYISPSAKTVFGYDAGDMLNRPFTDFLPEESIPIAFAQFSATLASGEPTSNFELTMKRCGNELFSGELNASVIIKNNKIIGTLGIIRDVTERKRMDEILRNSMQTAADIVNTMPSGLFIYEFKEPDSFYLVDANPEAEKLTGILLQEWRGREFNEIWPKARSQGITDKYLAVIRTGNTYETEDLYYEDNRIAGAYRIRAFLLPTQKLAVAFEDITERKQAADALQKSEERFRLLVQYSNDIIEVIDANSYPIYVGDQIRRILGYQPEDLMGQSSFAGIHPDDLTRVVEIFTEGLAVPGAVRKAEYRYRHKDGHWVDLEAVGCNLLHDPRINGVVLNIREVTERKKAESALLESERRFMNVLYASSDAILLIDDSKFVDCNEATAKMMRYNEKEKLLKTHPSELSPPVQPDGRKSAEKADEMMRLAFEKGFHRFEWMHRRANGEDFPVEVSLTPIVYKGRNLLHCVWRDISGSKQVESEKQKLSEQLQQAMKMEAIGRLAGGVAHDFNNLLTGISGNVQLALMDLKPNDPLADSLGEISQAADSAASLTRQLLAFSRKQLIEPKLLDLNELIRNMHKMLARLIGEDIELKTVSGKHLGAVRVDPGQFEQVLVNLAVNARDAMPDGGRLVIETANVEFDAAYCKDHPHLTPGNYVLLAVSDTGSGMSEHVKAHLFEPFFTTKEKGKGTGLGLATIFGAVKQSGGSIDVQSELGKGTTFRIVLPRAVEKAERLEKDSRAFEIPGGSETVLLVEDEKIVRDLAIKVLKRLGYKVLHADSGGDALFLAEQYADPIHLLLTDVVMPGMNGRMLAERMLTIHPEIKVLYTSGYTEDAIAHHGIIEAGLNFIGKPYSPRDLAHKLRDVLGGGK